MPKRLAAPVASPFDYNEDRYAPLGPKKLLIVGDGLSNPFSLCLCLSFLYIYIL